MLLFLTPFIYIRHELRVLSQGREGNVCRKIASTWNLPVVRLSNVLVIFDGSYTVDEGTVPTIVDIENASS